MVLAKTAYSPLLKVAGDYSCGLFDVEGEMVAQGPDLPIHLGSMPLAVKAVIRALPSASAPGDVFIHNDPYFGGSHLPDVNVVTPAFHEGTLLGWACVRAHWPDIGSGTPGSYGATTEIYGEGLRLPPCASTPRACSTTTWSRSSSPTCGRRRSAGATSAPRSPPTSAAPRASPSWRRSTGPTGCSQIMQEVMDYSERMMRAALAAPARRHGELRGLLRRRRHHRGGREGRRGLLDPHAGRPSRATGSSWTSRAPTPRCRGR